MTLPGCPFAPSEPKCQWRQELTAHQVCLQHLSLLIWISSTPACLCTPIPAAPGCAVWYPASHPSSHGSHRSQWNGYALEAHQYYSIFWRCFCCLDWRAQGPRHCTELIVTPGLCRTDCRLKPLCPLLKGTYVTVYVRARCFAACGHAVTWQNLVFFKFMIQVWWIYLPEDLTLRKWPRLPSATTQISVGDASQVFLALCRDVSMTASLLFLYFLCEGHKVSTWHVVNIFLNYIFEEFIVQVL